MLKFVFFTGLLLSVAPAAAQTQSTTANNAAKPAQAQGDPNRLICETEQEIGSRLAAKRVCMTAAQWKEHQQQVRGQLDQWHTQNQSAGGPG